jgi:hypothetical protein
VNDLYEPLVISGSNFRHFLVTRYSFSEKSNHNNPEAAKELFLADPKGVV